MKSYLQIAFKYLQNNRRRTVITMVGIVISAVFMFALLDALICLLHYSRNEIREELGYEAVFFEVTESQMEQMKKEYNIADYVFHSFTEYSNLNEKPVVHKNAAYVKFAHPFYMTKDYEKICDELQVEGILNEELANSYHIRADGSLLSVMIAFGLLICYIVGGIAVMVTKNTLKLSVLEKVRDYGVLRCIGTSMKQLKRVVILEAVSMAIPATLIGSLLGYLLMKTVLEELSISMDTFFSPVALLVTMLALLTAMYFSSIDPCKMLGKITPVMAMNNQLTPLKKERKMSEKRQQKVQVKEERRQQKQRAKAEKNWKQGKSGFHLYGRLFGIEGEYAYKSMKQNRRKYYGTMFAFALSVIVFLTTVGVVASIKDNLNMMEGEYGYYNVLIKETSCYGYDTQAEDYDKVDKGRIENLQKNRACNKITELYRANMYLSEDMELSELYSKEFMQSSRAGKYLKTIKKELDNTEEEQQKKNGKQGLYEDIAYKFGVMAVDEKDFALCEDDLQDGTLKADELGEDGIVLINQNYFEDEEDDYGLGLGQKRHITITNYKVGDKIEFLDLDALRKEYEKQYQMLEQGEEGVPIWGNWHALAEARKIVQEQGKVKTYVVKGILSRDAIGSGFSELPVILCRKDQFCEMTGWEKGESQGYQISIDMRAGNMNISNLMNNINALSTYESDENGEEERTSGPAIESQLYIQLYMQQMLDRWQLIAGTFVFVLFSISTINIINNNASSIYLRKTEFAGMRVIGMTKKRLMKMLALEGIIMAGVATVFGSAIGVLLSFGIVKLLKFLVMELEFHFPILGILLVFLVTVVIMLISTIIPVAGLNKELVEELAVEE